VLAEYHPARYWHRLADGRLQCDLCPRYCQLRPGKRGACYIRMEQAGELVLTSYGRSSGFCIDPIEKKPLNHFLPGSTVLSFGTAGCNLSCRFCQNWAISKSRSMDSLGRTATPVQIANAAVEAGCQSVAFTYNDPVIFLEYATDVATACQQQGLKTVAVTAGYICPQPRSEFFQHIDAANIDLKAFSERFYQKLCSGSLAPALDTLSYLQQETQVWFEITNLLIPDENDSEAELEAMCQWIVEHLGRNVPLHFSAFHPDFKLQDKPRTPLSSLQRAYQIAKTAGINYVYLGNVHAPQQDTTFCARCNYPLIGRDWYRINRYQLTAQEQCPRCGEPLPGVFQATAGQFSGQRLTIQP